MRLRGTANRSLQILEMGPGYCPAAPKSEGWKTHVVDHATRDELRTKYAPADVDTALIEDVDTIWRGGPLQTAVPADLLGQVDLIIASHVLEHIPDLIGFLQSASQLVKPNGSLSIALPDRRYCFDCFRPWTTTGDLLEAHHAGRNRHNLRTAYDHMAYSSTVDGRLAWGPHRIPAPKFLDPFAAAATTLAGYQDQPDGSYQDYHAWQFSPAGFQIVMLELAALGVSDWQVQTLDGPENFEFFAVLRRGGLQPMDAGSLQARRQHLLLAQLIEVREQIDFITGPNEVPPTPAPGPDRTDELIARLDARDRQLQEMAETLAWLRVALSPVRHLWRRLRGRS